MKNNGMIRLSIEDLEVVTGGVTKFAPQQDFFWAIGLGEYIRCTGGKCDEYFDTLRDDGTWKNVGSEDMVAYIGRVLGEDSPRYQALIQMCTFGSTTWQGNRYLGKRTQHSGLKEPSMEMFKDVV